MSETTRLKLPFIMAAQAQKHVTHNEALLAADALVHLGVATRQLASPPPAPAEGARYLVAAHPSGDFLGRAGAIAAFDGGAWRFHAPDEGWRCWVADEGRLLVHTGGAWTPINLDADSEVQVAALGVGTAPDAANRLAVKSDAVLLSHDDVTPGTGHLRVTLNKSASARDGGIAFQTGYSTRALLGTFGSDAFTLRVSPDGSAYSPVLAADPGGKVALRGAVDTALAQPIQLNGQVRVSADRMTVEAASAVGVGLHLSNTQSGAHGGYLLSASGAGAFSIADQTSGARLVVGPTGNILPGADNAVTLGEAGKRFSAVYATTGTIQTSDRRDKVDVAPVGPKLALALLDAIEPVTFRWREPEERDDRGGRGEGDEAKVVTAPHAAGRHAGFLAQEVRAALDAAGTELGVWGLDDGADAASRQWLRPDQMIPLLWEALRETRRELAALKAGGAEQAPAL
ncbi:MULTISPECIES: DUF2793 domain-containing protein [unclassified Aureimonas]|uniref:DUF2793 domain-containing protein n=1 Tax=unclassified Aureimonas TaxID=2615206 RepID=UPI0006F7A3DB|nr:MULTISPECIES: DUF2793 domain-containing protein [unclassified Aureimonas]KQT66005.1 hypothetical protein ASG62_21060 [Aureimonas sp. Leaf427]KQT73363.1 hypothetical protein ASG54_17540 [Aureimonas sp. Leaf460]